MRANKVVSKETARTLALQRSASSSSIGGEALTCVNESLFLEYEVQLNVCSKQKVSDERLGSVRMGKELSVGDAGEHEITFCVRVPKRGCDRVGGPFS